MTGMDRTHDIYRGTLALTLLVNVNIQGAIGAGFLWGFLATQAENIRIFKGPAETCSIHPWDAMILRDCTTNTGTLDDLDAISSRKWDVLVMKMCEDHDCKDSAAPQSVLICT